MNDASSNPSMIYAEGIDIDSGKLIINRQLLKRRKNLVSRTLSSRKSTMRNRTTTSRQNAFLVTGLAFFFWWAFESAKHDPILRHIIPFGEDPFDAVSSFGVIAAAVLAFVSLVRSNFPRLAGGTAIYALRAEAAVPFCILVTISAEAVAMMRHRSMWVGMPGSGRLLLLETSLASFAGIMLLLTRDKQFGSPSLFARAAVIWVASLLILALYPEQLILKLPGHMLTVVLGDVFLFAPVAALVKAWLPGSPADAIFNPQRGTGERRYTSLAFAVALGFLVGACAYLSEVIEGQMLPPINRILFVSGVFVVLGACGAAIGYVFLGRLLGFGVYRHSV